MEKSGAIIKSDKASNWEKAINYIPDKFTIIVYEYEDGAPRIKVGDGITTVSQLPFLTAQPPKVDQQMLVLH